MIAEVPPRDPLAFDYGVHFQSSAERVAEERAHRMDASERTLGFYNMFLNDYLGCIFPNDLILIGAATGVGKTELARSIAASNARAGKRVHYFALEAEPLEIERRTKFTVLVGLVAQHRINMPIPGGFSYRNWYAGRCEPFIDGLDATADIIVKRQFETLHTYYRGSHFAGSDVKRLILAIKDQTDLIVLDHLHYVDIDDENENRGLKATMKTIRDVALGIGKPVILVAHVRKLDTRSRSLVPSIDDVMGSSDIAKICTRAILIAPASKYALEDSSCEPEGAGTFFAIRKDRVSGALHLIALCDFDWRERKYRDHYVLGHQTRSGEKFEPLRGLDAPSWATGHKAPAPVEQPHWTDGGD